jgi:hypothetical protein
MPTKEAKPRATFPPRILQLLLDSRMLGIRAGEDHRFTGIWFVVVAGRVFVRPWNDKAAGWHRALLENPRGAITLSNQEIPVRARPSRGERLFDSIDAAYAAKYPTPASQKWVRGFALPRRRRATMELRPG